MQLLKPRTEPPELSTFKILDIRMYLMRLDKQNYLNLKKGYEGEVMFDSMTENLQCDCLIINDLQIQVDNKPLQIDTLIITSESIYVFEVKNFFGDYFYESDRLYTKNTSEVYNPLLQLNRIETLLRQLLKKFGFNLPIVAKVIFINPEFTLYQAPMNLPFIFPTQINRYLKEMNQLPSNLKREHLILADRFISLHRKENPFSNLPNYNFDSLKKGLVCAVCSSFALIEEGLYVVCKQCRHKETAETSVLRNITEFKLLFPNEKITTNVIYEWCKPIKSKKRIQRILGKNFKTVGVRQWAYYV